MSKLQYTHEEMVRMMDKAKRDVLEDIKQRVKGNFGQKFGEFTLISREAVLKDIKIVMLDNGLEAEDD